MQSIECTHAQISDILVQILVAAFSIPSIRHPCHSRRPTDPSTDQRAHHNYQDPTGTNTTTTLTIIITTATLVCAAAHTSPATDGPRCPIEEIDANHR
jgi:hypothetical protein